MTVIIPTFGIDIDRCVDLAADLGVAESGVWRDRAACLGKPTDPYFAEDELPAECREQCERCIVRTECAVEGLRTSLDRTLAESPDELWGYFGGLGSGERWELLQAARERARARGVALVEATSCRPDLVVEHHERGWSIEQIADELCVRSDDVADALVIGLGERGWSNRRIAAVIPGRSYKWVERRRRVVAA